jgi:hypothetical protein
MMNAIFAAACERLRLRVRHSGARATTPASQKRSDRPQQHDEARRSEASPLQIRHPRLSSGEAQRIQLGRE